MDPTRPKNYEFIFEYKALGHIQSLIASAEMVKVMLRHICLGVARIPEDRPDTKLDSDPRNYKVFNN